MSEIPSGRIALHWRHNQRDRWRLKSQAFQLFTQLFVQVQIEENIKAPRHWPLWGKFNGDRWISRTKSQWRGFFFLLMTSSHMYKKKSRGFLCSEGDRIKREFEDPVLLKDARVCNTLLDIEEKWKRAFDTWSLDKMIALLQTIKTFQMHLIEWKSLRWRHNDHAGVSNHQPHGCLLNRLFRRKSKKTSELRVTGLCAGNSPGTGEFPAQMASYAENVAIWWRHHVTAFWFRFCCSDPSGPTDINDSGDNLAPNMRHAMTSRKQLINVITHSLSLTPGRLCKEIVKESKRRVWWGQIGHGTWRL